MHIINCWFVVLRLWFIARKQIEEEIFIENLLFLVSCSVFLLHFIDGN